MKKAPVWRGLSLRMNCQRAQHVVGWPDAPGRYRESLHLSMPPSMMLANMSKNACALGALRAMPLTSCNVERLEACAGRQLGALFDSPQTII
jgi:hypothetical protein